MKMVVFVKKKCNGLSKISGILTMWNESKVSVIKVLKGGYSISVKC